jgi:hypothetical protein
MEVVNFMSIGNDPIVMKFKSGLNMITGTNLDNPERKNAVGKSTLMNAFFWGQYGETIGKIKNQNIINYITKKKGFVKIVFDVTTTTDTNEYTIVRKLKPNSVDLFKDGVDITRDSIKNTNAYIDDLVSSNADISKCCDIMSISDNAPFMTQTAEKKRKFISNIFNIMILDIMTKDVKAESKEVMIERRIIDGKIASNVSNLELLVSKKADFDSREERRQSKIKDMLSAFDAIIKEKAAKIDEMQRNMDKIDINGVNESVLKLDGVIDRMDDKMVELNDSLRDNKHTISSKEIEIRKYNNIGDGVSCTKCLQDICADHTDQIELQKVELQVEVDNLTTISTKYTEAISKLRAMLKKKRIEHRELVDVVDMYEHYSQVKDSAQKRHDEEVSKKYEFEQSFDDEGGDDEDTFGDLITEAEKSLAAQDVELTDNREETDVLDICKFTLGDEGVKSIIVKKLLTILNSNITAYLGLMGLDIRCEFDEYFDETIKSKGGNETSYYNCSGAERKTIDIACSLAFSDLRERTCGIYSNVKFFDEIFDSAFDERGLDMFIEMLKEKITDNGWSVYAISHRKEAIKHIDGQVVELQKENDITTLI